MDRVNAVICHPLYLEYYHRLERAEKERIFCRHQMSHLLDVARIAYIRNLEKGYGFRKDVIYAAAVLRTHWKSFCMKRTKRRGCVFHVRQTGNVTGVKRRKIWR